MASGKKCIYCSRDQNLRNSWVQVLSRLRVWDSLPPSHFLFSSLLASSAGSLPCGGHGALAAPCDIPPSCQEERPLFPIQQNPRTGSPWPGLVTQGSLKPRAGWAPPEQQGLRRARDGGRSKKNLHVRGHRRWAGTEQAPPQRPASPPLPAFAGGSRAAPTRLA